MHVDWLLKILIKYWQITDHCFVGKKSKVSGIPGLIFLGAKMDCIAMDTLPGLFFSQELG